MDSFARRLITLAVAITLGILTALRPGMPFTPAFAYSTGDLTYHGGSVLSAPTNYLVFWLPPTYGYEYGGDYSDAQFEELMEQYMEDICPSKLYNILTQYSLNGNSFVKDGPIKNLCTYGGAYFETKPYPHNGTNNDPLGDGDIKSAADDAKSFFKASGLNNEFFVVTASGMNECGGGQCTFKKKPDGKSFCAWHASSGDLVYAFVSVGLPGCSWGVSPNDIKADSAVNTLSHEQFESVSDPQGSAWYYQDGAHEIADECNWSSGGLEDADGTNFILNNDRYRLQWEWSNALHACAPSNCNYNLCGPEPKVLISAAPSQVQGELLESFDLYVTWKNWSGTDPMRNTAVTLTFPKDQVWYSSVSAPVKSTSSGNTIKWFQNVTPVGGIYTAQVTFRISKTGGLPAGATIPFSVTLQGRDYNNILQPAVTASTTVTVNNAPPTFDPLGPIKLFENLGTSFKVTTHDPNPGDHVALSATGLPPGLTFKDNGDDTGTVSGVIVSTRSSTYHATFTANDGHNPPVKMKVLITIAPGR